MCEHLTGLFYELTGKNSYPDWHSKKIDLTVVFDLPFTYTFCSSIVNRLFMALFISLVKQA